MVGLHRVSFLRRRIAEDYVDDVATEGADHAHPLKAFFLNCEPNKQRGEQENKQVFILRHRFSRPTEDPLDGIHLVCAGLVTG